MKRKIKRIETYKYYKKTKPSAPAPSPCSLPPDICFEIMSYFDGNTIIRNCFLISKVFYQVSSTRSYLSIVIPSRSSWIGFLKCLNTASYIPNITSFTIFECANITLNGLKRMSEKMPQLTYLDISGNRRISNCEGLKLVSSFKKLKTLKFAQTVPSPGSFEVRSGFPFILEGLIDLKDLTELDLNSNLITDSDLEVISKISNLRKLNIRNNSVKNIKPLGRLTELKVLDMRNKIIYL